MIRVNQLNGIIYIPDHPGDEIYQVTTIYNMYDQTVVLVSLSNGAYVLTLKKDSKFAKEISDDDVVIVNDTKLTDKILIANATKHIITIIDKQ